MFFWGMFWGWWITITVMWYVFAYIQRKKANAATNKIDMYRENYNRLRVMYYLRTNHWDEVKEI